MKIAQIIKDVENYYELPHGSLIERNRTEPTQEARKLAMYLARRYTKSSWPQIGDAFHRDHTTVISSSKNVKDWQARRYFDKKYSPSLMRRLRSWMVG